jgi:peptide-methionine (S)-S-oxide reductase
MIDFTRNRSRRAAATLLAALCLTSAALLSPSRAAEINRVIPLPATEAAAPAGETQTAVIAGGCFWGVQAVFQHVKGVSNAVSGYAGGTQQMARYDAVSSGVTAHAEAVRVTYDPKQISYGRILQIYFSVAHDPTQLDRQGPDSGKQYRSAIFPANAEQEKIASAYIDQLNKAGIFKTAIVTKVTPGEKFYPAEAYHQNYLKLHPSQPYIVFNDLPKIESLKRVYPDVYRPEAVLVAKESLSN